MAFPAIVGSPAESATTTAGTTHTINLPSGAAGNLFLLILGKGSTSATINALTGWTELVDESQAWGGFVAWRLVDGTEGATTAFTSSASTKSATIVYEISGWGGTALSPEISAVGTGTSAAPDPNTLTPTGGAKDYLWITFFILGAAGEEADDDTWCNNAATNYGSLVQKTAGVAGTNISPYIAASSRTNNAASEDAVWPASTTDQSLAWRAWTVAVHPLLLLVIQDAAHAHAADVPALTQHNVLAVADAGHSHPADNVALTQHNALVLQEAAHAHFGDNVVLTAHDAGLVIQDAIHTHAADSPALVQHNLLAMADAVHAHVADGPALIQHNVLAFSNARHLHFAEGLTLIQHHVLGIQDALSSHAADNVTLDSGGGAGPANPRNIGRGRHRSMGIERTIPRNRRIA